MSSLFVQLYRFFNKKKWLLYLSLVASISIMAYFAMQIKFEENIARFFPDTENEKNLNTVFNNLRIKDKIIVLFSAKDSTQEDIDDLLIECGTIFKENLQAKAGKEYIDNIVFEIDENLKSGVQNYVYDNLPVLLTENDYTRMTSFFDKDSLNGIMKRNYSNLLSPTGSVMKEYITRDPLGLAGNSLKHLQDLQLESDFEEYNGHIFAKDGSILILVITPTNGMGSTGMNDRLITLIEEEIATVSQEHPEVISEYYGGPSVSVYNARQIKSDSILTSIIALVVIIAFISLVFKSKATIPLIISPALFGGLFALFIISLIKGSISAIAVGSGSIVLGIALSYSIHMVVHQNHVTSIEQLIEELTYPLTVGSFTTIGAFLGLLFTSSDLLRDFGLFASMSLIGTTLFCLIYLPHFLKAEKAKSKGRFFHFIERINSYRFDKNKWLVGGIVVLTIICVFTSQNVGFESDMMKINYEPKHIKDTENKLLNIVEGDKRTIIFVSIGKDLNEAALNYKKNNEKLASLLEQGLIEDYASAEYFLVSDSIREQRANQWKSFWTVEKQSDIKKMLEEESKEYGFRDGTFNTFYNWLQTSRQSDKSLESGTSSLLKDWYTESDDLSMLISQVKINNENKAAVYAHFDDANETVIFDRAYFTDRWVSAVNDDFYLVLFISSFLIFFTLLISYGRIELAVISFLPMFISWIIIIGIMGMFGLQFNIVNIILSTFIFGIGDDFSIFIQDGLLSKYRTNKKVLDGHKTAIFCSAFTIVVGMGVLVFAKHPALQSISSMSILGMIVVVLVSYTIPPFVFRLLISNPTSKGLPPYTLFSILTLLLFYFTFLLGCIVLKIVKLFLQLLPIAKTKKRSFICRCIYLTCKGITGIAFIIKYKKIDIEKDSFSKPSIIIANHESFLDILYMLSLSPKLVMVTNQWVWKSPFFGSIIRYAGYFFAGDGYETSVEKVKERLDEGYSIIIFPEGTRSADGNLKRFHKGAFYYAEQLKADITPVIIYGAGMIINKKQPFYIRRGLLSIKKLKHIPFNDTRFGDKYKERAKLIAKYFAAERAEMYKGLHTVTENPYFYNMLIKNYIYKGPVEEWYVRIKVKMEKSYQFFDQLIPPKGQITDIGCGYGTLNYMLTMLSPDRRLLGIDYDKDKIEVAQCAFLKNPNTEFSHGNALEYNYPQSDVFVMNDILHYMSLDKQETLVRLCSEKLNAGGMLIIRDGNSEDKEKQKVTKWTEIFSTRIFKFNKTVEELSFIASTQFYDWATKYNLNIESLKNDKYTSNTIYILTKKKDNE